MVCIPSLAFPFTACALSVEVLEWREVNGGGAMAEADRLSAIAIPASLPLSFAICRDLGL
jgi:hypothetical protein